MRRRFLTAALVCLLGAGLSAPFLCADQASATALIPVVAALPGNDIGDFDDDGIADIVWRNFTTGETAIWFMNGGMVKSTRFIQSLPLNWRLEVSGDLDGDGAPDLVWRLPTMPNDAPWYVAIWFMNNGDQRNTTWPSCCVYIGSGTLSAAGDFDGDGHADLVWRRPDTGATSLMHMNGRQVLSFQPLPSPSSAWTLAGSGDFNGDGKPDLVYRNYTTGENAIWMMNDMMPIESRFTNSLDPAWQLVAIGDYNGDGWSDLVWRNPTTVQNAIWYMNGTTVSWTEFFCASTADWQIAGPR